MQPEIRANWATRGVELPGNRHPRGITRNAATPRDKGSTPGDEEFFFSERWFYFSASIERGKMRERELGYAAGQNRVEKFEMTLTREGEKLPSKKLFDPQSLTNEPRIIRTPP